MTRNEPAVQPRLTRYWALIGVGILFTLVTVCGVLNSLGAETDDSLAVSLGAFAGVAGLAVLAVWLYRRVIMDRLARRDPVELPHWPWWRGFVLGALGGITFIALSTGVVVALGGYRFESGTGLTAAQWFQFGGLVVASGVLEELLFRGVLLQAIEPRLGWAPALILTGAFFGASHLANPSATVFGALAITVEAGVLLGAVFLLTRRLWPVIGLHAAWNATEALLGIPVSGTSTHGLARVEVTGSDLLTGGAFGIEASIVPMIIGGLASVALLVLAHRRGVLGRAFGPTRRDKSPAATGSPDQG